MIELRGDLDLSQEALGTECVGKFRLQDLERDGAVVLQVLGEVDGGHPAVAELALEAVAVGESRAEGGQSIGHRPDARAHVGWCQRWCQLLRLSRALTSGPAPELVENTTASAGVRWPWRITNRELYH